MSTPLTDEGVALAPIPEGYEPFMPEGAHFLQLCGPFYRKFDENGLPRIAMHILPKHLNMRGIPHGGMMVTLADASLGFAINHARGGGLGVVTASLTTDFIGVAKLGDWVEAHVTLDRVGARMAFGSSLLKVRDKVILKASAVFAVVKTM